MPDKLSSEGQQGRSRTSSEEINEDNAVTAQHGDPVWLTDAAESHRTRFQNTGKSEDLEEALSCIKQAISLTPSRHLDIASRLGVLAQLLDYRYAQFSELADLEKAIEYHAQAISFTPQDDLFMTTRLSNLGNSIEARYEHLNELEDLEKAIEYKGQAVSLTPQGHPAMPVVLNNLGDSFDSRFERLGELADLDKAIEYKSQALSLAPQGHPLFLTLLNNLAYSLSSRFRRLGQLENLDKAIDYTRQAVALMSEGHPDMSALLSNLASSLASRFKRLGELSDLREVIDCRSQALSLTPQGHTRIPILLNNLGYSLETRFERLGERADLDRAIEYKSQAVSLTPQGHVDMPRWLDNLGTSLHSRFKHLGELPDLDKAIECKSQAISLVAQDHPNMSMLLNNLAMLFHSRFERLGELVDLDKSIKYSSESVALTPQGYPGIVTRLNNLGCSYQRRFERLGDITDQDKAIEFNSQAVSLTPEDHPEMSRWLSNLGYSFLSRFKRLGEFTDLEKAIEHNNRAVELMPQGHSHRPGQLSNLAKSLESRYESLRELTDLNDAIQYLGEAISLTAQSHLDMPTLLNNLGLSLQRRFQHLDDRIDLDKAIKCNSEAVALTPDGHAAMPRILSSLGDAYNLRSKLPGMSGDVNQALDCFQKAAEYLVGSPSERFHASLRWARMCAMHRAAESLSAYRQAMSLLPQLIWLGSAVDSRYRSILDAGSVSTEAAAVAITMENYGLAIEWLEEGRSIVWKQMLQLRTPLDHLATIAPTLAAELGQVGRDLDHASSSKPIYEAIPLNDLSLEQAAQKHRRLAERWEDLLDQARHLPGFEAFLCPRNAPELLRSAQSGPVVVVNVHENRCDALIIKPGLMKISHIPLHFSHEKAKNARLQMLHLIASQNLLDRGVKSFRPKPDYLFKNMLAVLWTDVVKPVLDFLGYMKVHSAGDLPHITWCTTGPLSFLPLHAAGDYGSESMIFNYVISSYTPTLSALLSPPLASTSFRGILAISQKSTPGMSPLPGTAAEIAQIQERAVGILLTRLDEHLATPPAVLTGMQEHSWVHFACHASQNARNPLQSAFYVHEGVLDLASITSKQLKDVELAFLSACQTATGDENLPEEAVHLAAGMLMAGYRTVIATMWSIGDEDAPLIAEKVYQHLLEGGVPDARRAAVAVHKATECLRAKVGMNAFGKWVPYIHIGL